MQASSLTAEKTTIPFISLEMKKICLKKYLLWSYSWYFLPTVKWLSNYLREMESCIRNSRDEPGDLASKWAQSKKINTPVMLRDS